MDLYIIDLLRTQVNGTAETIVEKYFICGGGKNLEAKGKNCPSQGTSLSCDALHCPTS